MLSIRKILLILDGDKAGKAATTKHAHTLSGLLPHVQFTQVQLPDGEDANSVLQNHDDAQVLAKVQGQSPRKFENHPHHLANYYVLDFLGRNIYPESACQLPLGIPFNASVSRLIPVPE